MKCRERNIDYCQLKRDWSAQCVQRCSECKYICKGNKRIIKDDKLQTLGISFSIPSGVATVGGGVPRSPKCLATTALCGLRAR